MNTIVDLIPAEVLQQISRAFREFKTMHGPKQDRAPQIVRDIFRNEYNNSILVPNVYPNDLTQKRVKEGQLVGFEISVDKLKTTEQKGPEGKQLLYPQVVQAGNQIYKAVSKPTSRNTLIYALLQKKGYHDGEFHIYEYFNPDQVSIVEENAVEGSVPFSEGFNLTFEESDLFTTVTEGDRTKLQLKMDEVLKNKLC